MPNLGGSYTRSLAHTHREKEILIYIDFWEKEGIVGFLFVSEKRE